MTQGKLKQLPKKNYIYTNGANMQLFKLILAFGGTIFINSLFAQPTYDTLALAYKFADNDGKTLYSVSLNLNRLNYDSVYIKDYGKTKVDVVKFLTYDSVIAIKSKNATKLLTQIRILQPTILQAANFVDLPKASDFSGVFREETIADTKNFEVKLREEVKHICPFGAFPFEDGEKKNLITPFIDLVTGIPNTKGRMAIMIIHPYKADDKTVARVYVLVQETRAKVPEWRPARKEVNQVAQAYLVQFLNSLK